MNTARYKNCSRIEARPFRCVVWLDCNKIPQGVEDPTKVSKTSAAFIYDAGAGSFYVWLGGKEVNHATIAHECLHLVDGITRYSCHTPTATPTLGDLADETRAHLLLDLYEQIQKIMIKKHKYPKR